MSSNDDQLKREIEIIDSVANKGAMEKAKAYSKLSGPGWLQGAITLGGGSLAGALYLGIISGYGLLWLQPLAMICGIIMLSAIAYVTLSTGERPFGSINRNLSPVLGWSWLIAAIMANIVWCMPQFNLGVGALQQNLIPFVGKSNFSTGVICLVLLAVALYVNRAYQSGSEGIKTFERILKSMVGVIVVSFFLVVVTLAFSGAIPWGKIFAGVIPNFSFLFQAAPIYDGLIESSSDPDFWKALIADEQQNRIIAAFGTAVGINMTFLLPYSMLRKKWGRKHRGLGIFDLSIGLFVPFVLATGCVLIASASSFHNKIDDVLDKDLKPKEEMKGSYGKSLGKIEKHLGDTPPNESDKRLAAMLANRDNYNLANTLKPIAGTTVSQFVFGVGVLGMALSTIIILMLINGFAFQELFGKPNCKQAYFIGCLVSGIAGVMGPFIWGNVDARTALAIPTSVIGGSLIPIAYFTFLLMMNSRSVLGEHRPKGGSRYMWNLLMIAATSIATFGSVWVLLGKSKKEDWTGNVAVGGLIFLVVILVTGIVSFLKKEREYAAKNES